ncbi:hypothetical protein [Aliiglaciecola sp. M165]|uniref:hypothetical protein n=1 Tax=Aliiglaciecola sp. M165 TaxID=2593649 RepID=UPI00117F3816|nr:hypothetical protein [Aliiglaciecola sp. M165]TRY29054.1 hypothetical protein FM019_19830 [Aliiglaciecola sp. M165]
MKLLAVSVSALLLLQGCYLTPDFQAKADSTQQSSTSKKFSAVQSTQSQIAIVEVDKYINAKFDKPAFKVVIVNQDQQPVALNLADIKVLADGQEVTILDPKLAKADRERMVKLMTSNAGNRGTRSVNRGPNAGFAPLANNSTAYSVGLSKDVNYKEFISQQLTDTVVKPMHTYSGYVTLDRENLDDVKELQVSMYVDSEEHVFNIVRNH